jgi:hypothetical protein
MIWSTIVKTWILRRFLGTVGDAGVSSRDTDHRRTESTNMSSRNADNPRELLERDDELNFFTVF